MIEGMLNLPAAIHKVTHVLADLLEVCGVLCFGSYALGTHDDQSDVDLYVICQPEIAPRSERQKVLSALPGLETLDLSTAQVGWSNDWCPQEDRLRVDGLAVEITYNRLDWLRTVISKVRQGHTSIPEMAFRPYTLLGLLENSIPLYDPDGVLASLYDSLRPYPPVLTTHLIEESLVILADSIAELKEYNRRGIGNRAFHFHVGRALDALELVLFAANEQYPPASKRVEQALEKLPNLPQDFNRRYQAVLETPLDTAGRQAITVKLEKLLEDTRHLLASLARDKQT